MKDYYQENKEFFREQHRQWRKSNPELMKQHMRNYYKRYPEKYKIYNQKRQHKNHDITKIEWESCKKYFDNTCAYCGFSYDDHKEKFKQDLHKEHVDHLGANDLSNCVPACKLCNSSKWEYSLDEWYNENNPNYTKQRYAKILQWINFDYKFK